MSRFCTENRFNEKVSTMETIETLNSTFPSSGCGARDDASTTLTTSGSSKLVPVGSDLICMLRMESFSQIVMYARFLPRPEHAFSFPGSIVRTTAPT